MGRKVTLRRDPHVSPDWDWKTFGDQPFVMRFSEPCRHWTGQPTYQQFFGGMIDAFDLIGVGEGGELVAVEAKYYGGPGWRNDASAFLDDKVVMAYDGMRALSKLRSEFKAHPDQQRLFEPDEVES